MADKRKHIIDSIEPGSIAEEMELEPGDELVSINGKEIEDVFDYHYLMNDDYIVVTVRKENGEEWELEIEKDVDDSIIYHSCYYLDKILQGVS